MWYKIIWYMFGSGARVLYAMWTFCSCTDMTYVYIYICIYAWAITKKFNAKTKFVNYNVSWFYFHCCGCCSSRAQWFIFFLYVAFGTTRHIAMNLIVRIYQHFWTNCDDQSYYIFPLYSHRQMSEIREMQHWKLFQP